MSFFEELKRRNVFRVGIAYAVASWLLLQLTEVLTGLLEVQADVGKIVIILLIVGFIPALIFAWAFELTPEGVRREKDIDRDESIAPHTGKKLDRVIILGLVAVIAVMGIERFWFAGPNTGEPSAAPTETAMQAGQPDRVEPASTTAPDTQPGAHHQESVAVLPFTAMSSGEDDEYFADGLTEEILNSLAGLPELLVTARTSSFHFKNQDLPIPEIAKILGVNHVVEGSVRRSGERVRITAQLIRAEDGFHLWSDTYDRTLEDIFAVQEDIAANIAETLDVVLNEEKRTAMREAGIGNVEAFIAFQKGMDAYQRAHTVEFPITVLPEANQWFDAALAIVPDLDSALYLRTDLYGHILLENGSNEQPHSAAELETAVTEIINGLARASRVAQNEPLRVIMEAESLIFSDDWSRIPALLETAFTLGYCNPINWMAEFSQPFGYASALAANQEERSRCDPLAGWPVVAASAAQIWDLQPEKALETAETFLARATFNPWVDDQRFKAKLALGHWNDDPGMFGPNPEGSNYSTPRVIDAYAASGQLDQARAVFEDWRATHQVNDGDQLIVSAILGERNAANQLAARIDARVGGSLALSVAVSSCNCGAPFDLDATPNFKARIEEAGFNWPPVSPIKYPAKDW